MVSFASNFLLFLAILTFVCIGGLRLWVDFWRNSPVTSDLVPSEGNPDVLFVLVHGYDGFGEGYDACWTSGIKKSLAKEGDVLVVRYPAYVGSNADPTSVAYGIAENVQVYFSQKSYKKVVLVGYSMGALIARRAFLTQCSKPRPTGSEVALWVQSVDRIVLLAGTNRGVSLSGNKPMDISYTSRFLLRVAAWTGKTTGIGKLALAMEAGAPFVANLRIDWMDWYRRSGDQLKPPVIQLLGDIDDLVSKEDNMDLGVSSEFVWLKVHGTGHADIFNFNDESPLRGTAAVDGKNLTLGFYREKKFLRAATFGLKEEQTKVWLEALRFEGEKQGYKTDNDVKHVVFVLHGIRDAGKWYAGFEDELRERANSEQGKIAIIAPRYGYFGMGPFLVSNDRQKYVRWFMDEYTETIARFPNAKRVDFIGHSHGTYILASALEHYESLKVERVVFGGSVVPKNYDWCKRVAKGQVKGVRNYVANDDWVVGLLPRIFEYPVMHWLNRDIGSAGFNGFDNEFKEVENVKYITGGHGAFLNKTSEIADSLMLASGWGMEDRKHDQQNREGYWTKLLKFVSDWCLYLPWCAIPLLLVYVGLWLRQFGAIQLGVFALFLVYAWYKV